MNERHPGGGAVWDLPVPDDMIEFAAAELWRHDNPKMSVFDCTTEIKELYRDRVRIVINAVKFAAMK